MIKSAILVLLYSKEIYESNTIASILRLKEQYADAKLVIWNNGPNPFTNTDCSALTALGYQVSIQETLNNESLAVIYNRFLNENQAERYILLDDDSVLNDQYVIASMATQSEHLAMPIISFKGDIQSPTIDHKRYVRQCNLTTNNKVITIGSGLVLGSEFAKALNSFYGSVFDERFYFYAVDTTFCQRVHFSMLTPRVQIIPGFEHALSRLTKESSELTCFRRLERSYAMGLRFRYYTPLIKAIFLIIKVNISVLKNRCIGKKYKVMAFHLIKAFFSGKHYRVK